jgi:3D-(3,5/4)-trihydroxycyclohexane-1,2-dione acylhydrolase (decyclizing)
MGARAVLARTEDEIRAALGAARQADRITVIHVPVSPYKRAPGYEGWWDVPPAATSAQEGVRSARGRYDEAVSHQRRELL